MILGQETLSEAVQEQVEQAFVVQDWEQQEINEALASCNKVELDYVLSEARRMQAPGLQNRLAEALVSGSKGEVYFYRERAYTQAVNAHARKMARALLHNMASTRAKIAAETKLQEWNEQGYLL